MKQLVSLSQLSGLTSELTEELKHQPAAANGDRHDLFEVVWPYIEQALATPRTDREAANLFQIELKQAQTWLRRAVRQGKKLQKPVRYVVRTSTPQVLPLFDPKDPVL